MRSPHETKRRNGTSYYTVVILTRHCEPEKWLGNLHVKPISREEGGGGGSNVKGVGILVRKLERDY